MKAVESIAVPAVLCAMLSWAGGSVVTSELERAPEGAMLRAPRCPEWETLDRFEDPGGQRASAYALLLDTRDRLFSSVLLAPRYNRWIIRRSSDRGKTWTTSDSLQIVPDQFNYSLGMTEGAGGSILVAGVLADATRTRGVIRRSLDGGRSWSSALDYLYPGSNDCKFYEVKRIGTALFALGRCNDGTTTHWMIQRSLDNGTTWTMADFPDRGKRFYSKAFAITRAPTGVLFALGTQDSDTSEHMIIRRSTDGGNTWTTVDDFQAVAGNAQGVTQIMTTSRGAVLANGWSFESGGSSASGLIRRSADGGATWTTTDAFKYNNQMTLYGEIAEDSWGRLFAIADVKLQPGNVAVLRLSTDDGRTWRDHAYLVGERGKDLQINRLSITRADEMLLAGNEGTSAIVRRLKLVAPDRECR